MVDSQQDPDRSGVNLGARMSDGEDEAQERFASFKSILDVEDYRTLNSPGELVMLRRNKENQASPAIQAINGNDVCVGQLPYQILEKLLYLLESKLITMEGRIVEGNLEDSKNNTLVIDIEIYAQRSLWKALTSELAWVNDMQDGSMESSTNGKEKRVLWEVDGLDGVRNTQQGDKRSVFEEQELLRRLIAALPDLTEKSPSIPSSRLGSTNDQLLADLTPQQVRTLQWMINRENPILPETKHDPPIRFWTRQEANGGIGGDQWLNVASKTVQKTTPVLGKGGVVVDGEGANMLNSLLALILATKNEHPRSATLIISSESGIREWEQCIQRTIASGRLSWYTYNEALGSGVETDLDGYDVVFTTQAIRQAEQPRTSSMPQVADAAGGPLFRTNWKRVVADISELGTPSATFSQGFAYLRAETRWILAKESPIRSIADLGALLTSLKLHSPLDKPDFFRALLYRPIQTRQPEAEKMVQTILADIILVHRDTPAKSEEPKSRAVTIRHNGDSFIESGSASSSRESPMRPKRRFDDSIRAGKVDKTPAMRTMVTAPRRTFTSPLPTRPSSPGVHSAPVQRDAATSPVAEPIVPMTASQRASSLLSEISRLTAACEEHERNIRAIRTGIEHRLFVDLPTFLSRFQDLDTQAEETVVRLHGAVKSANIPFDARLKGLVEARKEDVEVMRKRTSVWVGIDDDRPKEGIVRVIPTGEEDGYPKVQRWAEAIEEHLEKVNADLEVEWELVKARRALMKNGIKVFLVVVVGLLVWVLHWLGLFRGIWMGVGWIYRICWRRRPGVS